LGKFREERDKLEEKLLVNADILKTDNIHFAKRPANCAQGKVEKINVKLKNNNLPTILIPFKDLIGNALPRLGAYGDLDNKQQAVAVIDDVKFPINLINY
jgi:hypothetical protein